MTKEQLADQLQPAITKLITDFVAQKSPESQKAQEALDALEEDKAKVIRALGGADSPAAKAAIAAIQKQQDSLTLDPSKDQMHNRRHAAWALVHAANNLKLPVRLREDTRRSQGPAPTAERQRSRITKADLTAATDAVYRVLPPAGTRDTDCLAVDAIATASGLDKDLTRSALGKLKRDGRAESNGRRGPGGGWRRVK